MPIAGDIQSLAEEIKADHQERSNYLKSNHKQVKVLMADIKGFMNQVKVDRETRKKIIVGMLQASKGERKESFNAIFGQIGKEKRVRAAWMKGLVAMTRDYQKGVRNDLLTARKAWLALSTTQEQKNEETEEQGDRSVGPPDPETNAVATNGDTDNDTKPKKELSEKQKAQYKKLSEQMSNIKRDENGKFVKHG